MNPLLVIVLRFCGFLHIAEVFAGPQVKPFRDCDLIRRDIEPGVQDVGLGGQLFRYFSLCPSVYGSPDQLSVLIPARDILGFPKSVLPFFDGSFTIGPFHLKSSSSIRSDRNAFHPVYTQKVLPFGFHHHLLQKEYRSLLWLHTVSASENDIIVEPAEGYMYTVFRKE